MEDNPFSKMVEIMKHSGKSQIPAFYRFGKVISINPLKVDVSGNIQNSNDLLKNDTLIDININVGDTLFLIPIENEQRYYIVGKVVNV